MSRAFEDLGYGTPSPRPSRELLAHQLAERLDIHIDPTVITRTSGQYQAHLGHLIFALDPAPELNLVAFRCEDCGAWFTLVGDRGVAAPAEVDRIRAAAHPQHFEAAG